MKKFLSAVFILLALMYSCKPKPTAGYIFLNGFTQGTTFNITYQDLGSVNYMEDINRIFRTIDSSMSVYKPNSIISGINRNDSSLIPDVHFLNVVTKAIEIAHKTDAAFDITVGPLVNAWGFGHTDRMDMNQRIVDSLLTFVGIDKIKIINGQLKKSDPRVQIDVNAIAQGYTVDLITNFLASKGVENLMVEIGGDLRVKGVNPKGESWRIGVDKPIDDPAATERELQTILLVQDIAMATSGNYRKFYILDGLKYSHTINPKTGFPVNHNLLSATVFAENGMEADAYATAFMVMGLEKTIEYVKKNPEIDVYLIYDGGGELGVYYTERVAAFFDN